MLHKYRTPNKRSHLGSDCSPLIDLYHDLEGQVTLYASPLLNKCPVEVPDPATNTPLRVRPTDPSMNPEHMPWVITPDVPEGPDLPVYR